MCGIAGWFCQGSARPSPETAKGLLLSNQERGISATGVAWRDGDKIRVRKSEGPAQDFIKANADLFKEVAQSPIGLLHARATTKGSEKQNENNHPVVGFDWAVIHNGTITNDDDLWEYYEKKLELKRFADVDTSVLPLVLAQGKTIEESMQNLSLVSGSATLAAWSTSHIGKLVLARKGTHDLHMFLDEKDKILYWSSSGAASFLMKGTIIGRHKFMPFSRLADEHVLLLSPEGWSKARVFKLEYHPFYVPFKPKPSTATIVTVGSASKDSSGTLNASDSSPVKRTIGFAGTEIPHPALAQDKPNPYLKSATVNIVKGRRKATVEVETPGHRQMTITWSPIDETLDRPWPMSTVFTPDWWDLQREIRKLNLTTDLTSERSAAYGRWIFKRPDKTGEPFSWEFKPYKRTKDWMEQAYRMRLNLPQKLEEYNGKMVTEFDAHWAWEHYDMDALKANGESMRLLGFCCPWCGVWASSVHVQHNEYRCEFCHITNRLAEGVK
jgi:predicted glutamine amidotransferase